MRDNNEREEVDEMLHSRRLAEFYLPFTQVSGQSGLRSTVFKPYSSDLHVAYIQVMALGSGVVVGLDTMGVKL
jgi:hypothetical protein